MAIKRPAFLAIILAMVVGFCSLPASAVYQYGNAVFESEQDCFEFLDSLSADDRTAFFNERGIPDGYLEYRQALLENDLEPAEIVPVVDSTSEPEPEPDPEPDPEPESDPESEPESEPEPESSEPDPETVVPDDTPSEPLSGSDMLTVNISEESVAAIAQAVATGNEYTADTEIAEGIYVPATLMNFPYFAVYSSPSGDNWGMIGSSTEPVVSESLISASDCEYHGYTFSPGVGRVWNSTYSYNLQLSFIENGGFIYSNFNIVDEDGNVVHVSDLNDPVVSFDTGNTGLVIDPVPASSFVLPNVSVPGFVFSGWYLDAEYTEPYTGAFVFTEDTILYGRFEEVPPMEVVHETLFDALGVFFGSTPMTYILSIFGLIVFVFLGRKIIGPRLH